MVIFKMHDSVPSVRYSPVCNVLRPWRIWLIPTYRVYRLYDIDSKMLRSVCPAKGLNLEKLQKSEIPCCHDVGM